MRTRNPISWLESLTSDARSGSKRLAVLVDPEDAPSGKAWLDLVDRVRTSDATDVFVGGSLVTHNSTQRVVQELKRAVSQPVVLFPGATTQVVGEADALLFLSLISGRNPDLLIGRHVEAAPSIARLELETVPTGYMLIGDPPLTAAAHVPQPSHPDVQAVGGRHGLAGEMLGLRCLTSMPAACAPILQDHSRISKRSAP